MRQARQSTWRPTCCQHHSSLNKRLSKQPSISIQRLFWATPIPLGASRLRSVVSEQRRVRDGIQVGGKQWPSPFHLNLPPIQGSLKSICVTLCGLSSPTPKPKAIHVDILNETAIVECCRVQEVARTRHLRVCKVMASTTAGLRWFIYTVLRCSDR